MILWVKNVGKGQLVREDGSLKAHMSNAWVSLASLAPYVLSSCRVCPRGVTFFLQHGGFWVVIFLTRQLASNSECFKRQKVEVASMLGPELRNWHSVISTIFCFSKESQTHPDSRGREIDPTSPWDRYQRI